jgi:hypothetical protein
MLTPLLVYSAIRWKAILSALRIWVRLIELQWLGTSMVNKLNKSPGRIQGHGTP